VISPYKQNWSDRRFLTREEVCFIHAFHSASFWISILFTVFISGFVFAIGQSAMVAIASLPVALAFSAAIAGTLTDFMSMRIPDRITGLVLLSALTWWCFEALAIVPAEGLGNGQDVLSIFLPGRGEGSIAPDLTGTFFLSWIALDIAAGFFIFIPLMASFVFGLGFGGGDVKLMTALVLFLGWPLGFDFVILTYFFGGIASAVIISVRTIAKCLKFVGVKSATIKHISEIKTFAYAPAISFAALICVAQKAEGFF
jgi:Flp pilus assembly protein protease CpaA